MKQRIQLLMLLAMLAVQGWAAPVDESSARAIVQDFIVEKRGFNPNSVPTSGSSTVQLLHAEMSSVSVTQNAYYIYSTGDGFVIVAGDDRAEQILGYGDEELDMNDIPCGMQFMLDSYKEQIDYLFEHPSLVVETPSMNAPRLTATSVAPMLTAKFNQGKPYNNLLPTYNGRRCLAGCACVALCQVMHYWQYPTINVPSVSEYTTRTHHIYMPALPSDRFHWNYIKADYNGSYTADEAYSVAKLMKYAGQAMEMDYSPDGSGAAVFQIRNAAVLFGYDHNAKVLYKEDNYTDAQWAAIIQAELIAGRPIVFAGWSASNGSLVGHAFNIDGYNASKNLYHINWGWGGSGGYYALNAFNTSNYHFNDMQQMIVGLEPQDPEIVVTPTSLSFSAKAGETKTATFTVHGYALTGDLTVKLNNGGTVYTIDKTSITMSDAAYGATVTVTYKPTEPGTSNASVKISGGGAASKTISLSGTANPASTIHVPSSLSFSAITGETKTATFTVSCPNAISNLSLKLNNGGGIYSINKTSISKSAAINGATVTVTYKPTEAGSSNASITISGGGAEPKTVSLSGTAVKPAITVDPTSLSFGSVYTGESKSATFAVSGTNLTGNLSLKLRGHGDVYFIDKTSISKSEATSGATVTVTFKPTEGGANSTVVDISGGGADPVSVSLSGLAIQPKIAVSPDTLSFSSYVNNSVKKNITITGSSLTGDLSLALNDTSGNFSISTTNLTLSGSSICANVSVTYNPTTAGVSNAILTVSGGGAEPQTMCLTGVAEDLPNVEVDASSVALEPTYTGYLSSQTITITCPDLKNDLQLDLIRDNTHSFGLSKSAITPEEAAAGIPVTIYFSPTTGGFKRARLSISYDGCNVVTIPVIGYGIKSDGYITAWPVNLSFEAQAGTAVIQTFNVSYSDPNGSIMISSVGSGDETNPDTEYRYEETMPTLNAIIHLSDLIGTITHLDSLSLSRKDFIGPIEPFTFKSLVLELAGDDCFEITPSRISLRSGSRSAVVTVTYHPEYVGEHDATITIRLSSGSAKPLIIPLHGSATNQLYAPNNEGSNILSAADKPIVKSLPSANSIVDELSMSAKVYAAGHNIIIESPVEQSAIISDISGHVREVNLLAGRNEVPVNASGIYIVRIREKTAKLVLK